MDQAVDEDTQRAVADGLESPAFADLSLRVMWMSITLGAVLLPFGVAQAILAGDSNAASLLVVGVAVLVAFGFIGWRLRHTRDAARTVMAFIAATLVGIVTAAFLDPALATAFAVAPVLVVAFALPVLTGRALRGVIGAAVVAEVALIAAAVWRPVDDARMVQEAVVAAGVVVGGVGLTLYVLVAFHRAVTTHLEASGRALQGLEAAAAHRRDVERSRAAFLNTVAHELGTPLTSIRLQLALLSSPQVALQPRQQKALAVAQRSVRDLATLARRFLDLARLEVGRMTIRPTDIGASALVVGSCEARRAQADERQVTVTMAVAADWRFTADAALAAAALDSLVDTALRVTPSGGHVHVTADPDAQAIIVQCPDSTVPLEAFLDAEQARDRTGHALPDAGLGLHFAARVATALDGRFDVRPHAEGGVALCLTLAADHPMDAEAETTVEPVITAPAFDRLVAFAILIGGPGWLLVGAWRAATGVVDGDARALAFAMVNLAGLLLFVVPLVMLLRGKPTQALMVFSAVIIADVIAAVVLDPVGYTGFALAPLLVVGLALPLMPPRSLRMAAIGAWLATAAIVFFGEVRLVASGIPPTSAWPTAAVSLIASTMVGIAVLTAAKRRLASALAAAQTAVRARARAVAAAADEDARRVRFLNAAAHAFGTPLTPLRVESHLLATERLGALPEPAARSVAVIDRNVTRLTALVGDALRAARDDRNAFDVDLAPAWPVTLVRDAAATFQEASNAAGVLFKVGHVTRTPVLADSARIAQVLGNFVTNALKATRPGDTVTLSARRTADTVQFDVTDTGRGFAPEEADALFEPFVRDTGARTAATPGAGLGLAICRLIAEAHGGRVWCASSGPGLGATFTLELPVVAAAPPDPNEPEPARPQAAAARRPRLP